MALPDDLKIEDKDVCLITWRGKDGKQMKAFREIDVSDAVALIAGEAVIVAKTDLENVILGMEIASDDEEKWDSYYEIRRLIKEE